MNRNTLYVKHCLNIVKWAYVHKHIFPKIRIKIYQKSGLIQISSATNLIQYLHRWFIGFYFVFMYRFYRSERLVISPILFLQTTASLSCSAVWLSLINLGWNTKTCINKLYLWWFISFSMDWRPYIAWIYVIDAMILYPTFYSCQFNLLPSNLLFNF